jgi:Zn-dependent protease with chaperone function
MRRPFARSSYRYPNEQVILGLTLLVVGLVIALTATATVCGSLLFVLLAVGWAYSSSLSHHQNLMSAAFRVSPQSAPQLARLADEAAAALAPGTVDVFVVRQPTLNAYTFGLSNPKVIVLYSGLLSVMDEAELRFIIGHEMGHVALGHTWLNSLVGGLAGIPSGSWASILLRLAFLRWNRACELSADRAGLLACGSLEKSTTALIKLVAGPSGLTPAGMEAAYRQIDGEDDTPWGMVNETFQRHPLLIRRIQELRKYAGWAEAQTRRSTL